ncbi:hypothetical protein [Haloferula rosea]|uniref:Uncharacterized protein n=1 Tax=Haloferula rosea TaxID=490093 RepID=A0A934RCJ6_9BACT|nr:hypothetical protein [Haloferula rosea]MBK1825960.1 hypothetical protein [Haloferula rosea]
MRIKQFIKRRVRRQGFSLVITITMMVLLSLLAIGLLSLASVTLRSSSQSDAMNEARGNARMALMLAIGELQKHVGQDTRVTANASLVDASTANPYWVGVWKTRTGEALESGDAGMHAIDHHESPRFLTDLRTSEGSEGPTSWLVSQPSGETADPNESAGDDWVTILETNDDATRVRVPRVRLDDDAGSFAWWVSDESQKARVNLPDLQEENETFSLVAAQDFDLERFESSTAGTVLAGHSAQPKDRLLSVASLDTAGLLDLDAPTALRDSLAEVSHHLTAHSEALFTDVKNSGLKRDLTTFMALGDIADRGGLVGIRESDPILPGEHHQKTGPRFGALKGWSDLADELSGSSGMASLSPRPPNTYRLSVSNSAAGAVRDLTNVSKPAIQPVVVEASLGWDFSPYSKPGQPAVEYMRAHIMPRLILWNPYNVTLTATRYVTMLKHPLYGGFQVRGQTFNTRSNRFYFDDFCGKPTEAFLGFVTEPTELLPGETKIFTPSVAASNGSKLHGKAAYFDPVNYSSNVLTAEQIPGVENFYYDTNFVLPAETPQNRYNSYGFSSNMNSFYATPGYSDEFIVAQDTGSGSGRVTWSDVTRGDSYPRVAHFFCQNWGLNRYHKWYGAEKSDHPSNNGTQFREFRPGANDIGSLDNRRAPRLWRRGVRMAWFDDEAEYVATGKKVPKARFTVPWFASANIRGGMVYHSSWLNIPFAKGWQFPAADSHMYFRQPTDPSLLSNFFPPSPVAAPDDSFPSTATLYDVPRSEVGIISLGQLQHAQLSYSSWHPSFVIGHSQSTMNADLDATAIRDKVNDPNRWTGDKPWEYDPLIQQGRSANEHDDEVLIYDLCFEANEALWDRFMVSSIPFDGSGSNRRPNWDGQEPLPVGTYVFNDGASRWSRERLRNELTSDPAIAYFEASEFLVNRGAINVNTTSKETWKALLSSMRGLARESLDGGRSDGEHPLSRSVISKSPGVTSLRTPQESNAWNAFRSLSDTEINNIATLIVRQVQERGPFLSVADFVNRRLNEDRDESRRGLLDQAIKNARTINRAFDRNGQTDTRDIGDVSTAAHRPEVISYGLPGFFTQGDLLTAIAPAITARGDTFKIRAYGEAERANGSVARAWCEAVVQRSVDYLDPTDAPTQPAIDVTNGEATVNKLAPTNLRFGRRFNVVSFRWLSPAEFQI